MLTKPVPCNTLRRRLGYIAGWRWGLVCGISVGFLLGCVLMAGSAWLGAVAGAAP